MIYCIFGKNSSKYANQLRIAARHRRKHGEIFPKQ